MIPSIPETVARDTATSQQHATERARIHSEVETAQDRTRADNGKVYQQAPSTVQSLLF